MPRDYTKQAEVEIIIREISDQVAIKLRREGLYTRSISLWVGYSLTYIDQAGKTGFSKQIKLPNTNNSKIIANNLIELFRQYYNQQPIRNVGVSVTKLTKETYQQLSLFDNVETLAKK